MVQLVLGHRGYSKKYPENTIASFLAAILYGADGVELDVWLSGDGTPVVIHDRETSRVAGTSIDVKKASVEELKKLHLGLGQTIPTLEEVFKALPSSTVIAVEIKDADAVKPVYELAEKHGVLDRVYFISFYEEVLRRIRSIDDSVRLGFNIDSPGKARRALEVAEELKLYSINPPIQGVKAVGLDEFKKYLAMVKSSGYRVFLWTINNPGQLVGLEGLYDAVITDDVEVVVRALKKP